MGFYRTTVTLHDGEITQVNGQQSIYLRGCWQEVSKVASSVVDKYLEKKTPIFLIRWIEPTNKGTYRLQTKLWNSQSNVESREALTKWVVEKIIEGCKFDFSSEDA